ncbi:MAG: SurA N-terminal domain-containing protein [Candidatus Electrothrix sp. YB6]
MLNILRKQAQSPLIQAMVVVIAIVFIFWGFGGGGNSSRTAVATVNGENISYQAYGQEYDRTVENFRRRFGGQMPPGLLEQLGIRQQVLSQLIRAELIRQGGEEMGIRVSDRMVQEKIKKMDVFLENGKFDQERYTSILGQNRMTPSGFEEGIKSDLRAGRVTGGVAGFTLVPDSAVDQWLAYNGQEIKLAYVQFDPADFTDKVEVKEEELAAWFEQHKEQYRSDPKVRLKYLVFRTEDDLEQVEPAEEEVKALYESRKENYRQPERRHARHILLKVSETDSGEIRAEQKKKAEQVLQQARQENSDFAALATEYSEGPTKDRGGDLGFFPAGQMVPAFDKKVFAMQSGEVSDVVETQFGYHIIKLEEILPASVRSFEQVRDNLAGTLKKQQAKNLTFKRATSAYEGIMRAGSLEKYSQQGKDTISTSEYFSRKNPPEGMVDDPKFLETAFQLKKGELSSIVEMRDGYAVIFVDDIQEPALPELDAVREQVVTDYTKVKAEELASQAADALLAASREQGALQEPSGSDDADAEQIITTDFLPRSPAEKDAPPGELLQSGFALAWKEKLPEKSVQIGQLYYVYEVAERRTGTEADTTDTAERDQAEKNLAAAARNELVSAWIAALQARSTITTNASLLK